MTPEEYKAKLQQAEEQYANERRRIHTAYAMANNPHKKGDIISDEYNKIRIEKISTYVGLGPLPQCAYYGPILKKDNTPVKNKKGQPEYYTIYQDSIKTS